MLNFQLHAVSEFILNVAHSLTDSASDNTELSRAAMKLEAELDHIIYAEERRRTYV